MDGAVAGRGPFGPGSGTAKLDHFGPVAAGRAAAVFDADPGAGQPEQPAGNAIRPERPDGHQPPECDPGQLSPSAAGGGQETGLLGQAEPLRPQKVCAAAALARP